MFPRLRGAFCERAPLVRTVAPMRPLETLDLAPLRDDLERVESELRGSVDHEDRFLGDVASHLVAAGGKRLRPTLTLCAAYAAHRVRVGRSRLPPAATRWDATSPRKRSSWSTEPRSSDSTRSRSSRSGARSNVSNGRMGATVRTRGARSQNAPRSLGNIWPSHPVETVSALRALGRFADTCVNTL